MTDIIHCVTTMNEQYYNSIGKLMIHTWTQVFPANYKLHLYLEDFTIPVSDERIILEDYSVVQSLWDIWFEKNSNATLSNQKFSKKACTQIAFWEKLENGKSVWLDADMIFLKKLPVDFFETILENYPLASWGHYSFESGTVFVNLSHMDWDKILECYKDIYIGERGLPDGERWLDGEILGRAVKDSGVEYKDLWCYCDKKTSTPLNWSWIGEYMRHFKAKHKKRLVQELINDDVNRPDLVEML